MDFKFKTKEYYENLGKLFYAIASTDNCVKQAEAFALKKMIKKEWDYDSNLKYIEIVFNKLNGENAISEKCFKEFLDYKEKNRSLFTDSVKQLITRTAGDISGSFSNRNKSELVMLAQLEISFRNKSHR